MIYYPPLARASSLCPIHNSKFPPRPTCPTRPTSRIIACVAHTPRWRELVARAQFKIQNSQFKIHKKTLAKLQALPKFFYETLIISSNTTSPLLYVSH